MRMPTWFAQNTLARFMMTRFTIFIVAFMVIFALGVTLTLGGQVITSRMDNAQVLLRDLEQTTTSKPDFAKWEDISAIDEEVKARVVIGNQRYYVHGTEAFLHHVSFDVGLKEFNYIADNGLYYHVSSVKDGRKFDVWVDFEQAFWLLGSVIVTMIIFLIAGVTFGLWQMLRVVRRATDPLAQLTQAVEQQRLTGEGTIPTVDNPQEVAQLSQAFNQLITQLGDQLTREKQFIADASHELRTPLAGIRGNVRLIQRHGQAHPEILPDALAHIESASARMQRLVDELLQLSRLQNGTQLLPNNQVDVAEIIQKVIAEQAASGAQPIIFVGESYQMTTNETALTQIIAQLLHNAQKYTPNDAPIQIVLTVQAKHICISVQDQGSGIAKTERAKIFERFYRVDDSRSQTVDGTGLGLAIVANLVAQLHGQISVTDNQPQGSRFDVILPILKKID